MKAMASAIGNAQRAIRGMRQITMDVISSISGDGRIANTLTMDGAERRDIKVVTPYGIASSASDGMMVQIVVSDITDRAAMLGVVDPNKPSVSPGCIILYDKSGSQIRLMGDGQVTLVDSSGKSVTVAELYDHIHAI